MLGKFFSNHLWVKQKYKKVVSIFHILWYQVIPEILLFVSLLWTIIVSVRDFNSGKGLSQTLTIYLTGISISIAISSVVFSYAQCRSEEIKKELIKIGQVFLYASISLIIALLISWLGFKTNEYIDTSSLSFKHVLSLIVSVLFYSNFMYFILAVNSFHTGLIKLDKQLFPEVWKDIK